MATRRVTAEGPSEDAPKRSRRARTPEARENELIALAVDVAEQQLREGRASSQVVVHYLKLGSSREKLEQERLTRENELLGAKAEAMASAQRIEELYGAALNAMRSYAGGSPKQITAGDDDDDLD